MSTDRFVRYARQYRAALLDDVIPFWMRHAPDREFGGYFHSLDRVGTVIDTDKYMWLQNRAVWTFSHLYNHLEPRPEWLEMARLGVDFLKRHGRDAQGDWYFALARDGRPIVQPYNIFSDFFAIMAFSEYAKAAGDAEALEIAVRTYDRTQQRKDNPKGRYNKVIGANKPLKNLGVPMINLNVSLVMREIAPDPRYDAVIADCLREVMTDFVDDEARVVRENVTLDGRYVDSYDGRHLNPGHGIESMWFIMQAADRLGDRATVRKACEVTRWCLERGWDGEYGGIFYFMDVDGKPHIELQWDMKLWWPHVEALIACMLGYRLTGDAELLAWFEKLHDYTWSRFPDPEYGEWYGYLNRRGEVNNRCKGNRWKGCYHLPRALFLISRLCDDACPAQG